jgi:hypothetical protein
MASFRDYFPFINARPKSSKNAQAIADPKQTNKIFKVSSVALGFQGGGSGRANFEDSPYDFDRVIQAIDTDSYVKQAFAKYKELIWKEGWELTAENPDVMEYLHQRFDIMEIMMRRPIQDVFIDVGDQIVKFANAFLAKSRGDVTPFVNVSLTPISGKDVISGYYVVPAETMQISRDQNNKVQGYRQDAQGGGGSTKPPEWKPEDMLHFAFDKKPGRIFGTPFIVSVLDDVIALRQIEEDIQNLVHRELFPLYTYTVGTEENPADPEELDNAVAQLSSLRTDGGLVLPERHEVDVLGAENMALDASGYLRYFQERVVVGLGLAPHHLGIMNEGGNRSVTDRLDIALYDKVKTYQRYIADMIRILIINELLLEGGFDPIGDPMDRCRFRFREIDVDTQIKKQTHEIAKWNANLTDQSETRLKIGEDVEVDESSLLMALQARMAPDQVTTQKTDTGGSTPVQVDTTPAAAQKGDAAVPSQGGKPNLPNKSARATGNKVRPQNQFGRRNSPNVRHAIDPELLTEMVDLIDE